MDLNQLGLITFGAVIGAIFTWIYSAIADSRKRKKERKVLLQSLHLEIKQIRSATNNPSYVPDSFIFWPYIDSTVMRYVINSPYLTPETDRHLINLMVILITRIEEYKSRCSYANSIIAHSLFTSAWEKNNKSMYNVAHNSLLPTLSLLKTADEKLSKLTKLPALENEIGHSLNNVSTTG